MVTQVGFSVVGRSRGRVALCAVCTVLVEMTSAGFLIEPRNQGPRFVSGLASKPLGRFSPVWPQNRWRRFFWFGLKTKSDYFPVLALKSAATVWWFVLQNHCDDFLLWASKLSRLRFVCCTIKLMEGGRRRTRIEIWWLASTGSKSR
jgi:hypothetical protein